MSAAQDYMDLLPTALLRIQWLEEALKQYLLRVQILIACRTQDVLRCAVEEEVIWQMPLGKLAHSFERLCPNQTLAARVKKIVKSRNTLAHAGYVIAYQEQIDDRAMGGRLTELKGVATEADELMRAVLAEVSLVEGAAPKVFDEIKRPRLGLGEG
jgi:hypothetical protein